jgi:hypothetical protein
MTGIPGIPPGCVVERCCTDWAAAGSAPKQTPAKARTNNLVDKNFMQTMG